MPIDQTDKRTVPGFSAMIDIHCHLIPSIDDGPSSSRQSLEMARMAVADGTSTIIATPHQLGNYRQNTGERIRDSADQLSQQIADANIPLHVLPGGDVRIEPDLVAKLRDGDVLSLADHGKHVLLELPHELYFPLSALLEQLRNIGMTGILSHPERNQGILANPRLVAGLVDDGCLMQITAGSLCGRFGPASQKLSEEFLREGLVHFVASDGHGTRSRRPILSQARRRVVDLVGETEASNLLEALPSRVAAGEDVPMGRRPQTAKRRRWLSWRRSA